MIQFLMDTDHLALFEHGNAAVLRHINQHGQQAVGVCPVTVEESLRGRLAVLSGRQDGPARIAAYAELMAAVRFFQVVPLVAYDAGCEAQYQMLVAQRIRVGSRDLRIAACALANKLTVVTRNRRDFGRVPGLTLEDWSV